MMMTHISQQITLSPSFHCPKQAHVKTHLALKGTPVMTFQRKGHFILCYRNNMCTLPRLRLLMQHCRWHRSTSWGKRMAKYMRQKWTTVLHPDRKSEGNGVGHHAKHKQKAALQCHLLNLTIFVVDLSLVLFLPFPSVNYPKCVFFLCFFCLFVCFNSWLFPSSSFYHYLFHFLLQSLSCFICYYWCCICLYPSIIIFHNDCLRC